MLKPVKTKLILAAILFISLTFAVKSPVARAEPDDEGADDAPQSESVKESDSAQDSRHSRPARAKKSKGRSANGEAEGTEAYDRFEANTVVKSRYQLNGESLEVDPD